MNDLDDTMSTYERHRKARAQLSKSNKRAVFRALAAANITEVHVEFDGEGDSGQVTGISAFRGEERTELPATTVRVQNIAWGNAEPVTLDAALTDAIETLCYDYLSESNDGWENDGGAFGEFRLRVAARTVELEFNARYIDTFTSIHRF